MKTRSDQYFLFAACLLLLVGLACSLSGAPAGKTEQPSGGTPGTADGCGYQTDTYVNIAGNYVVQGGKTDQSGERYSGDATVTQIDKNCFSIIWNIDGRMRTGTVTMVGNIASGPWQEGEQAGAFSGIANNDGTLALSWGVLDGDSTAYSELLTKK